jgi:GABA(A) receptor-associated protein
MQKKTLEERKKEYNELIKQFPTKIFAIFEKIPCKQGEKKEIHKLIIPNDVSLKDLYFLINGKILKNASKYPLIQIKINIASNNMLLKPNDTSLMTIKNKYKDEDGFLYLNFSYDNEAKNKEECEKLLKNFPNKVPIIMKKNPNYPGIKTVSKTKFLMDKKLTIENFKLYFKKNHLMEGLEYFSITATSKYIPLLDSELLDDVFKKYNDEYDGFLYLYYSYSFSFYHFKLRPLEERKKDSALILQKYPNKIPILIEKDPNYQNNIELSKNKLLMEKTFKVYEITQAINYNYLHLKICMDDKILNITLKAGLNFIKLSIFDELLTVYENYKDEDGFLYVQYSYEYVEKTALPIIRPNYKSYPLEDRIGALNEMQDPNKTPVIIEKYPLSFIKRMTQKYYLFNIVTLNQLLVLFKKDFKKQFENEDNNFILMTETNIDLRKEENSSIKELFDKYKDKEDGFLYLYYIEPCQLPKENLDKTETNHFKKNYSLEQRKMKYKELKEKHPNKIIIIIEKMPNDKEGEEIKDETLFFNPNEETDSLRIKIWKKIGRPFMDIQLLLENKIIIEYYSKIIHLYNNFQDKEDQFLYLYYQCVEPKLKISKEEFENMSEARKIFVLFKRIPFIFNPAPCFANSQTKTKVFLKYKSNSSTFREIQTDKTYKYYIEYPNKELDLNEKMVDFYLKNKDKDDFLCLTIGKA